MKRLFLLVPDLQSAQAIASELEEVGIKHRDVHVYGGLSEDLQKAHLHEASVFQTTDLVPALKRGALLGAVLSVAIYLLFSFSLPAHVSFNTLSIVGIIFFGFAFGIWSSGMIGIGIRNGVVEKNEAYVKEGHYIMMVDAPNVREHELATRVTRHHPEAHLAKGLMH